VSEFLYELPPAVVAGIAAVYGLFIGSFLNVCIWRLPRGGSVVTPRSACPACGAPIPAWRNLPLVSWALLRGRAGCCGAPIALRYPLVELLGGVAAAAAVWRNGAGIEALAEFLFLSLLIVLFFTDLDLRLLPDAVTLPGTALGLLLSFVRPAPGPLSAFAASLAGFLLLLALGALWRWMRGIEAIGGGDVKMLAMMGAFLGVTGLFLALLLASVLGATAGCGVAAVYAARRTGALAARPTWRAQGKARIAAALFGRGLRRKTLPFGCFLAVGSAATVFWGAPLASWYAALIGL
jgi:leader peptidase (prepilin peptidase)/N-methyltransferase